jgi:hypothetical protein
MPDEVDIRLAADFADHRKTRRLVAVSGEVAVRCLMRLWGYAARHRPRGVLERMNETDIEAEARWEGARGALVQALVEVGYLDRHATQTGQLYELHDWALWQGYRYHAPERSEQAKLAASLRWEKRHAAVLFEPHAPHAPQQPLDTAVHRHAPPRGPPQSQNAIMLNCKISNAPVPVPVPSPERRTAVYGTAAPAVLQKEQQRTATATDDEDEWCPVRTALKNLGWQDNEILAVVGWAQAREQLPGEPFDRRLWPLAQAIYATRSGKRTRVGYTWSLQHEPADCDQAAARQALR